MQRLLSCLFVIVSFTAQAQKKIDSLFTKDIDEVVVTATKSPRLLGNVAIPISVINAKTLHQSGSLRLNEILSEQTGIVVTDNFGKGIQVQGLSSDYTLILLNGEPLIGRTGGVLDLSRLTVRGIKKIEIIKGPSSSLYGSEAMGGVVNIITDEGGNYKSDLNLRYARFNTLDGSFDYARKFNHLKINASFNVNSSEGYSLKPNANQKTVEPFWRSNQHINLSGQINKNVTYGIGVRHNNTYIKNSINVQNGGMNVLSQGFEKNNEFNINPFVEYQRSKSFKNATRAYFTGFQAIQELAVKGMTTGYNDRFQQSYFKLENQSNIQLSDLSELTLGIGAIHESVSSNRYDSLSTRRSNQILYSYAQWEKKLTKKLELIGGARYDYNSAYASVISPKLALKYKLSPIVDFNLSYGRGFKAPDFRQLYLNFTNLAAGAYSVFGTEVAKVEMKRLIAIGMLDQSTAMYDKLNVLKPETSGGLNVGMNVSLKQDLSLHINLFRNDLNNMIVTDVIGYKKNGGQIFSYFNLKRGLTEGLEAGFSKKINRAITVNGGYQFLYTADKDVLNAIAKGQVFQRDLHTGIASVMHLSNYGGLSNRSMHTANIKLFYSGANGVFATLRNIYRGKWGTVDMDGNGLINRADEFAKGYIQSNASVGYKKEKWELMVGLDNMFNYKDPVNLPGNPGRVSYINLQLHF
jgi:outer membrane receptor for ferrienterochelin and colicins